MAAGASVAAANAAAVGQVLSSKYNMIGNIGSALLGGGSNIASAFLSYGQQKKLAAYNAKLNYEYAEKSARNQPTWNRAGLESAGYNPMLAVQNSTSGANSSWTSAQSVNAPDIAGGISSGIANAQSFQRLNNETKTADTQAKANEATAENQASQALNNLEENKWISPKRKAEIANIQGNTALQEAQIDNMKKQIELGQMGITVQQVANANQAERNEIERKGNPFRTVRDFGDRYNWSPRQFGQELGRRFARDHFGRFYKGQ